MLQTVTSFVNSDLLVTDASLAKCIVLSIRLNFSKDPSVINAANAAVRQLFSCVFERVIQEDGMKGAELTIVPQIVREGHGQAPPTLRPCAADGYMLLKVSASSLTGHSSGSVLAGAPRTARLAGGRAEDHPHALARTHGGRAEELPVHLLQARRVCGPVEELDLPAAGQAVCRGQGREGGYFRCS